MTKEERIIADKWLFEYAGESYEYEEYVYANMLKAIDKGIQIGKSGQKSARSNYV